MLQIQSDASLVQANPLALWLISLIKQLFQQRTLFLRDEQ
jgi:hypothetical protein